MKRPRRGIERKILTSILWVGILPMALALIGGYTTLRASQRTDVMDDLAVSAQKTAEGVRFAGTTRLEGVNRLANEPRVIDAVRPTGEDGVVQVETSSSQREELLSWFRQIAATALEGASVIGLYDRDGRLVLATDPSITDNLGNDRDWVGRIREPTFVEFQYSGEDGRHRAKIVAPVMLPGTSIRLGYVSEKADVDNLLTFIFGPREPLPGQPGRKNSYQIVYPEGDGFMAFRAFPGSEQGYGAEPADPQLVALIAEAAELGAGTHVRLVREFSAQNGVTDAFVAIQRLAASDDAYIVVYRPASAVFGAIDIGAVVAAFGAAIIVAFLCIQAYRNVHNNIVRPVSLLNEGAQIIGQGDLELKLKIGTGDEIEELANSFNKMALALKRNIRQLEESEEKYRSVVTSMRDGILQTNVDRVLTFLNPAGIEIFGLDGSEEAIGRDLADFFLVSNDLHRMNKLLDKNGFVERTRVWMKRKDGRAICVELSANCMTGDSGEALGIEGIFRDVTKAIRLEKEARERAERLSAINQIANVINSSLEAGRLYENLVVEVKKLVDFDFAALTLTNEDNDGLTVRPLWPSGGPEEHRPAPEAGSPCLDWVAKHQECLIVENLHEGKGTRFASDFPAETSSCIAAPLYATDKIVGALNLGANQPKGFSRHDIEVLEQVSPHVAVAIRNAQLLENLQVSLEEVTRAREKLHEANEELKTLDEMKTNLLSNVSHELRTPLVAVMGYTDMILNEKVGPVNDVQRDYLSISLRNIDKLVTLIENLLDFSRLHQGTETLSFDTFDVTDCARGSLEVVQPLAESRNVRLELDAPETPVLVEGDKGKLGQVFINLLSNAIKFNHPYGTVSVIINTGDGVANIAVQDTGIGIPPEGLNKIFTRFYQYDSSSTRKYGGTGIGLSIAQDIARLHGSRIHVHSEVGKGSTFRFALPLLAREEGGESPPVPLPTETEALVALVSHDRALTTQVRNFLEPEGMELLSAVSAAHVASLARKHHPDCIVVDADANDNGHAVLLDILEDPVTRERPIILLTNDNGLYEQHRGSLAAKVNRGFRKSTLLSGIRYAMSQHGAPPKRDLGNSILCVDDDPEILTFIARCLEPEGYTVDTCNSGEEALEKAQSHNYGLVLLDIAMPGLDGWETCRRIRSDEALTGIKVYLVTAKPIEQDSSRAEEVGADGYLLKPFRPDDLVEIVRGLEPLHASKETQ